MILTMYHGPIGVLPVSYSARREGPAAILDRPSAATASETEHMTFAAHAAAIAVAKSVTSATQSYCRRRMIDSYLVNTIESAPLPVLRPN